MTPRAINMIPQRIKWMAFTETTAHKAVQLVLKCFGYQLVVEFDENGSAKDVYIVDLRPAGPAAA